MSVTASLLKAYFAVENAWYKALDFLDKRLHLPVYGVFINPVEKAGMPSLAFYFVLAALLGAGAYFVSTPQPSAEAAFLVQVKMGGVPVPGLGVMIEGGGLTLMGTTSSTGVAKFSDIPLLEELTLTLSRNATVLLVKKFDPRKARSLRLDLATELGVAVKMAVSSASGPVGGAVVSYSFAGVTNSTVADAFGEAGLFCIGGETVSYAVSAADFVDSTGSFTAENEKRVDVYLTASGPPVPPLDDSDLGNLADQAKEPEYGTVTVRVKDKETGAGLDASVKLRNVEDSSLVGEAAADNGLAVFSNVKINTVVYAFASAVNYVYDVSGNVTVEEETEITLSLEKAPGFDPASNASGTFFFVRDASGSGIAFANVSVFVAWNYSEDLSDYVLLETFQTDTNGTANATLLENRNYYASVSLYSLPSTGGYSYFPNATGIFHAGENQSVMLVKITNDKSCVLNATVYNSKTNAAVGGARVTMRSQQGAQLAQAVADSGGSASFLYLQRGSALKAVGTADITGTWSGSRNITLANYSNAVNVSIYPPRGKIVARAVSQANQSVPAAFYALQNGALVASCTSPASSCEMSVEAYVDTEVSASASGFLSSSQSGVNLLKDELRQITLQLFTTSEICGCGADCGTDPAVLDPTRDFKPPLCVKILGVTVRDERGYQVSSMEYGKTYSLEVTVASVGAHTTGVNVRVGDAPTAGDDFVFLSGADLTNMDLARVFAIRGSKNYNASNETFCTNNPYLDVVSVNRLYYEEANAFKWLEIEVANDPAKFAGGQTVTIPFKQIVFVPKTGVSSADQVKVYYRAWARRSANSTGGTGGAVAEYFKRVPFDRGLGYSAAYNGTLNLPAWQQGEQAQVTPGGGRVVCQPNAHMDLSGTCACNTGYSACGSACVDLNTDAAHCGNCATACAAGRGCYSGTCYALPSITSGPSAFPVTSTSATVTWTTQVGSNSTVFYGTTDSYGNSVEKTEQVFSHSLGIYGLTAQTLYYFKARGCNQAGCAENESYFTTAQCSGTVPPVSGPYVSHSDYDYLTLSWDLYTGCVSQYEIYMSTSAGFTPSSSTLVATITDAAADSYNVSDLWPGTPYYFKVRVVYQGTASSYAETSGTTAAVTQTFNSCPPTKTSSGYYVLGTALSLSGTGSCVSFSSGSDGSVLNCGGKTISGTGGNGVSIAASGVTVKNCVFGGSLNRGISIAAGGAKITGNSLAAANGYDVYFTSSAVNCNVSGNTITTGYYGLYFEAGSTGNSIERNIISGNTYCVFLSSADGNSFTGNDISSCSQYGFIAQSSDSSLSDNRVCGNVQDFYCGSSSVSDGGGNRCGSTGPGYRVCSLTCGSC